MAIPKVLIEEEKEHIRRILPLVLKKEPQFRKEIYVILSKMFPICEELKQILEEESSTFRKKRSQ